jgi:hypothetical protein
MHGPTCIFWANLTAFSLQDGLVAGAGVCGFGSGWHEAHFSEFELAEVPGHHRTPGSFLYDLLPPNRTTVQSFSGQWAGMILDVRSSLRVRAVGRLRAVGDQGVHRINVVEVQSGRLLLPADTAAEMSNCTTDLLNFCYSEPVELSLSVGKQYYIVSWEDARAGGDRTLVMVDSAAATTISHRDASTLTTYASSGVISGRVFSQPGNAASPKWTVMPQADTSFGVLNIILTATKSSPRLRTDDVVPPQPDALTLFKPHDVDSDGVCLRGMRQIFGRNYSRGCPCFQIPSVVVAFDPQARGDEVVVIAEGRWYIGDGCASPGRRGHSTLSLTAIDYNCLGIYRLILPPLLSLSVTMTLPPWARLRATRVGPGAHAARSE